MEGLIVVAKASIESVPVPLRSMALHLMLTSYLKENRRPKSVTLGVKVAMVEPMIKGWLVEKGVCGPYDGVEIVFEMPGQVPSEDFERLRLKDRLLCDIVTGAAEACELQPLEVLGRVFPESPIALKMRAIVRECAAVKPGHFAFTSCASRLSQGATYSFTGLMPKNVSTMIDPKVIGLASTAVAEASPERRVVAVFKQRKTHHQFPYGDEVRGAVASLFGAIECAGIVPFGSAERQERAPMLRVSEHGAMFRSQLLRTIYEFVGVRSGKAAIYLQGFRAFEPEQEMVFPLGGGEYGVMPAGGKRRRIA